MDVARHEPAMEIKGVTYTELRVRPTDHGDWVAQCVVDNRRLFRGPASATRTEAS